MFQLRFLALSSMICCLSACKTDPVATEETIPTDCTNAHWEYSGTDGPDHWTELCTGYSACGGQRQSPINLVGAATDATLTSPAFAWTNTLTSVKNNGHTLQVTCDSGSTMAINGKNYKLLQFHYHAQSEHTIDGMRYPLEVHYVHQATDGSLAVIGQVFELGAANPFLDQLISTPGLPTDATGTVTSATPISLSSLAPSTNAYFTYPGSLTTPPCTENVTWYVMKDHITASISQINAFRAVLRNDNRPIQSLNGRTIKQHL